MPKKNEEKKPPKETVKKSKVPPTDRKSEGEISDEEYISVVDYDITKKYGKRKIESNWEKYNTDPINFEFGVEEEDETPQTKDFRYLVTTASSDCSHFEFNSEKLWKSEENTMPTNEIFNLDLNILSNGLTCVPFYMCMGLNEDELTAEDKEAMDATAAKNRRSYEEMKDIFLGKIKVKDEESNLSGELEKTLEDDLLKTFDDVVNLNKEKINSEVSTFSDEITLQTDIEKDSEKNTKTDKVNSDSSSKPEKVGVKSQKEFFSGNDENLEDWLDSVLDD